jgi:hypothetical protein
MDDIKRQMQKRFEQTAKAAGWQAHLPPESASETAVPVWLYSVNANTGPRLFAQLYLSAYRDGGYKGEIPRGVKPCDVFAAAVAEYDALNNPAPPIEMQQQLIAAQLHYAKTTRTWGMLPPLNQAPGLHFVVFDWLDKKGVRQMRPAAAVGAQPLSPEALSEMYVKILAMHLANTPEEGPVV